MKKWILFLLCLLLAVPAFCTAEEAADAPVLPVFDWERSAAEHWHMLESGEKADVAAHTMEGIFCTVCGSEVWSYDDGSADIYDYDEFGNLLRYSSFDGEGALAYEIVYAYIYDEDGNVLLSREFVDGVLFGESTFTVNEEGVCVPVTQYAWYDDGTWALNEYDEHGNCIRAISCDAEDNITSETLSEYKLSSDGWYYEAKMSTLMGDASFILEYNEYGDTVRMLSTDENGVVWTDTTFEYAYQNGVKLWRKQYEHGILSTESIYDPEWQSVVKETEYYDDGTMTVSEFNDMDDPVQISFLLADGTVEMVQTYEYDYDEDFNLLSCKAYVDGVLVLHTEYGLTEDDWSYVARETMYNEDGSCIVCIFDENEDMVSETSYDANGNVIE